jgi:hypothetical protein
VHGGPLGQWGAVGESVAESLAGMFTLRSVMDLGQPMLGPDRHGTPFLISRHKRPVEPTGSTVRRLPLWC